MCRTDRLRCIARALGAALVALFLAVAVPLPSAYGADSTTPPSSSSPSPSASDSASPSPSPSDSPTPPLPSSDSPPPLGTSANPVYVQLVVTQWVPVMWFLGSGLLMGLAWFIYTFSRRLLRAR